MWPTRRGVTSLTHMGFTQRLQNCVQNSEREDSSFKQLKFHGIPVAEITKYCRIIYIFNMSHPTVTPPYSATLRLFAYIIPISAIESRTATKFPKTLVLVLMEFHPSLTSKLTSLFLS
jgi:hypothetical protein